uniref:Uncharacterized protein n=1 Tax=Anguilla anguilla TaxID=7936 RepID=A0A0E9QVI4_ANGAN
MGFLFSIYTSEKSGVGRPIQTLRPFAVLR